MQQLLNRLLVIIIFNSLLFACVPSGKIPNEIRKAGQEFRMLSGQKGHFNGGDWNENLDKWDGKKHSVMKLLADFLNSTPLSKDELLTLMGSPDQWKNNSAVYSWRGNRDYLVINCTSYCDVANWIYDYE